MIRVKLHQVISGKSKGVWGVPPRPGFSFARGLNLSFSNVHVCLLLLYSAAFKSKLQVLEVGEDLYSYWLHKYTLESVEIHSWLSWKSYVQENPPYGEAREGRRSTTGVFSDSWTPWKCGQASGRWRGTASLGFSHFWLSSNSWKSLGSRLEEVLEVFARQYICPFLGRRGLWPQIS